MLPFNPEQIESCLKQNLGDADGARALEMIASTYNLTELSTRPILLKFFADTFRELEQQKLKGATIDIGRLYETFVDQTLARDGGKHVIPLREKKWLLAELALHMHVEGVNEIANDELDLWLSERIEAEPALRKLQWGAGGEDPLSRFALFLQDLRNATLLVRPGELTFGSAILRCANFFSLRRCTGIFARAGSTISAARRSRARRSISCSRGSETARRRPMRGGFASNGPGCWSAAEAALAVVRGDRDMACGRRLALARNCRLFRLRSHELRLRGVRGGRAGGTKASASSDLARRAAARRKILRSGVAGPGFLRRRRVGEFLGRLRFFRRRKRRVRSPRGGVAKLRRRGAARGERHHAVRARGRLPGGARSLEPPPTRVEIRSALRQECGSFGADPRDRNRRKTRPRFRIC